MNKFVKFISSAFFKLTILLLINIAIFAGCAYHRFLILYFIVSVVLAGTSIFFLANRKEKDSYKVAVFFVMFFMPIYAIGYAISRKDRKGSKKIKKEWSDIIYRNRKSIFQNNEIMTTLKNNNKEVYKTCSYLVDTVGLPCFQNANMKYYCSGEEYFNTIFEECKNAKNYILVECYKIVPGKLWSEFFDILRLKAREGVQVRLVYDDAICTQYMPSSDYEKMKNHGIETIPFNKVKGLNDGFVNYRNYKRLCIIDGRVGFIGGYNISDEYITSDMENGIVVAKDCGLQLTGDSVKNLIVMFYEDYQFATNKVVNLQEYFIDNKVTSTKDWVLPYSTNPIFLDHTNKNILLSLINNAKESICIVTSYIALDDELKNALIINAKSGIKIKIIFCGEKVKKGIKNLSRSYFYQLIKEGIDVYEYRTGKMSTKLILIDNKSALLSTCNLDCMNVYKHFNAGVYCYGDSVSNMYSDLTTIINCSQLITIKDLQKRKLGEKISASWSKFIALFR